MTKCQNEMLKMHTNDWQLCKLLLLLVFCCLAGH